MVVLVGKVVRLFSTYLHGEKCGTLKKQNESWFWEDLCFHIMKLHHDQKSWNHELFYRNASPGVWCVFILSDEKCQFESWNHEASKKTKRQFKDDLIKFKFRSKLVCIGSWFSIFKSWIHKQESWFHDLYSWYHEALHFMILWLVFNESGNGFFPCTTNFPSTEKNGIQLVLATDPNRQTVLRQGESSAAKINEKYENHAIAGIDDCESG